jgi:protein-disulfide isomerase
VLAIEPQIVEKYVRTGKLKLVFRGVLNHSERSVRTTEAAFCAHQQQKFWQLHEILYEKQPDVWNTPDSDLVPLMLRFGQQIEGLDQPRFAKCINERQMLDTIRKIDTEQRTRGIIIQPIFEIGTRRIIGLQSLETMAAFIESGQK